MPSKKTISTPKVKQTKSQTALERIIKKPQKQYDEYEDEEDYDNNQLEPPTSTHEDPQIESKAVKESVPSPLKSESNKSTPKPITKTKATGKTKSGKLVLPSLSDNESDDEIILEVKKKTKTKPKKDKLKVVKSSDVTEKVHEQSLEPNQIPTTTSSPSIDKSTIVEKPNDDLEKQRNNYYEEEMKKFKENLEALSVQERKKLEEERLRFKDELERERAILIREKAEISNIRALKYQSLLKF